MQNSTPTDLTVKHTYTPDCFDPRFENQAIPGQADTENSQRSNCTSNERPRHLHHKNSYEAMDSNNTNLHNPTEVVNVIPSTVPNRIAPFDIDRSAQLPFTGTIPPTPAKPSEEPIIVRIPVEMLIKIFSKFYGDPAYAFKVGNKADTAFVISHVCHQWRNVAIHLCTNFWTTITIVSSPGIHRGHAKDCVALTSMAVHRSKDKELNIAFTGSGDEAISPIVAETLCVIMAQSRRIKSLKLHLPSKFTHLLSMLTNRIPVLSQCGVHVIDNDVYTPHIINAFAIAPKLERLTFTGFDSQTIFHLPSRSIAFYEDVRKCYASVSAHNTILQHLRTLPRVWYFRAVYQRPWMGQYQPLPDPIERTNIRVFVASQGALFRSVTLPFVRSIVVESNPLHGILEFTDSDCLFDVHDLIIRSQCYMTLTHIAVYNTLLTDDIFGILSELPLLMDLSFQYERWYEACDDIIHNIIKVLSSISENGTSSLQYVNPTLTRFAVTTSYPSDGEQSNLTFISYHLAEMIEIRRHPISEALGSLAVAIQVNSPLLNFPCLTDDVVTRLAACRSNGHNIRIAGFIDGTYMPNIIPDKDASVELVVTRSM